MQELGDPTTKSSPSCDKTTVQSDTASADSEVITVSKFKWFVSQVVGSQRGVS